MNNTGTLLLPQTTYHIYNHANGRDNLFVKNENYIFFLKRYKYFIEPIADTFAYCLMPNHLHLMVKIKDEHTLQTAHVYFQQQKNPDNKEFPLIEIQELPKWVSRVFGSLFSSYTQAFNKQQSRKGSLFMPSFKRKIVDSDKYYTQLIYYIHNNPVHHGFVKEIEDWTYSSYQSILSNKPSKLQRTEVLNWFGDKNSFCQFHQEQHFLLDSLKIEED